MTNPVAADECSAVDWRPMRYELGTFGVQALGPSRTTQRRRLTAGCYAAGLRLIGLAARENWRSLPRPCSHSNGH